LKIGMAGTGRMGAAIAQRLIGVGHQVTVWNRTAAKAQALAAAGARIAATPAALAANAEVAISMLANAAAINAAYHGASVISPALRPGGTFESAHVRLELELARFRGQVNAWVSSDFRGCCWLHGCA
jgi:3-hydroxyisobutyrate dehydrogenase